MRLLELEVGSWFKAPHWSEDAVGEIVAEVHADHGLATIHVYRRRPSSERYAAMRSRLATVAEMERDNWQVCERPAWVDEIGVGGSEQTPGPRQTI